MQKYLRHGRNIEVTGCLVKVQIGVIKQGTARGMAQTSRIVDINTGEIAKETDGENHEQKRRINPSEPSFIKVAERKVILVDLGDDDPGNQKTGNHEKDIDSDESAGKKGKLRMKADDEKNGKSP